MEHCRRQAASARKRVEVRRVNFAVQPFTEADTLPFAPVNRAVANAVNAMTPVCQHPSQVSTHETVGPGNPYHRHG
jgi:hypothetical protein